MLGENAGGCHRTVSLRVLLFSHLFLLFSFRPRLGGTRLLFLYALSHLGLKESSLFTFLPNRQVARVTVSVRLFCLRFVFEPLSRVVCFRRSVVCESGQRAIYFPRLFLYLQLR